jgi:hypothetical protein
MMAFLLCPVWLKHFPEETEPVVLAAWVATEAVRVLEAQTLLPYQLPQSTVSTKLLSPLMRSPIQIQYRPDTWRMLATPVWMSIINGIVCEDRKCGEMAEIMARNGALCTKGSEMA